jgi:YD repeat-containing protein
LQEVSACALDLRCNSECPASATTCENDEVRQSRSWQSQARKLGIFFVLTSCAAFLIFWRPPVHVELLPFTDSPPEWDGSYPYLVIAAANPGSKRTAFNRVFRHAETSSEFYGAQIAWNGDGWPLTFHDRRRFMFPEAYYAKSYAQGAPSEMQEAGGQRILLKRDKQRNLEQLTSPSGRTITFKYDGSARIIEATDNAGTVRKYTYDTSGHLESVADELHVMFRFEYARHLHVQGYDVDLMTAVADGSGRVLLKNIYDDRGRISSQELGNGDIYRYDYLYGNKDIVETTVEGPNLRRKLFFQNGVLTKHR